MENRKLKIFRFFLLLSSQVFGSDLVCPYGCGGYTDPAIEDVGAVFLQSLEKMGFLEEEIADSDYRTHEQVLPGGWTLLYQASSESYNKDVEEDEEDEDYEPQFGATEYSFSREKWCIEDDLDIEEFETNLSDYLETKAFIQTVFSDIHFCFDPLQEKGLQNIKNSRPSEQRSLDLEKNQYAKRMDILESAEVSVNSIYRNVFNHCTAKHNWPGSFYCRGLLYFQEGSLIDAVDDISCYLKFVDQKQENALPPEVYFYKGILESEIGDYNAAIESLSKAIKANPEKKETYFERAVAYYELGKFDLALDDYLTSGIKPHPITPSSLEMLSFSLGMAKGVLAGGTQSSIEFIPSLLSSLQGIGHGLWAFAQDPVQISLELVQSAQACIHFIKSNTSQENLAQLVPELRELFDQWDQLKAEKKGETTGYIIGKYGVDIFAGAGLFKGMKVYRDLKKANNLLTFEAMALSKRNRTLIKLESARKAQARQEVLCHANVKIQWDKQGKHIRGHKNFQLKNKSILEHPDPQKLAHDFCGTGIKAGNLQPGAAGYQEIVNFKAFIGYSVDFETGKKTATNWGKIHYAKDGIHIVPTEPRW